MLDKLCFIIHLNTLLICKFVEVFEFRHLFMLICFRNEGNSEPFNGVIYAFSLGTEEKMMNKVYENVKLQLTFLKTEVKDPIH